MQITSVSVQPLTRRKSCVAVASVVFDDCFIVRDIRLILAGGRRILAMPNRKTTTRCGSCGEKCFRDAKFCSQCGAQCLAAPERDEPTHQDVAHPLTKDMRELLEREIWREYEKGSHVSSGVESSAAEAAR